MSRTVLITGVTSGIGLAAAALLLEKGHKVVGLARRKAEKLSLHPNFLGVQVDLSNLDMLETHLKKLSHIPVTIDALVCNAGKGLLGSLEEYSSSDIRSLVDLNFTSQALLVSHFLPSLKRLPRSDLIFMGSEAALQGRRKGTLYSATKFALRGFAQALREELASSSVKVTLIQPGMVETAFHDGLMVRPAPGAGLQAEDVAHLISHVLDLPARVMYDEIVLSPQKKSVVFPKKALK